jgi:hypothetical protein
MVSILKKCYKFLPLFLGTICIVLMGLALLPGRLQWYIDTHIYAKSDDIFHYAIFSIGLLIGLPLLCILTIYEIVQIFLYRQNYHRFSGVLSVLILISTTLALSFDLPARLYFFTNLPQFKQALSQHILNNGARKNFYVQTTSFIPVDSPPQMEEEHGFAYLSNPSKTYYQVKHIYGKWYIFSGQNVDFSNPDGFKQGE